jgi:radical SAM superfamily enzyme YgiQ (UPF0313 family)
MQENRTIKKENSIEKAVLVGVNASFNHTSLAIRQLRGYCMEQPLLKGRIDIICKEYTINDPVRESIASLLEEDASIYGFSCYIWNISVILQMTEMLKKLKPDCRIVLGGPEISFEQKEFLDIHPEITDLVRGPGEKAFSDILLAFVSPHSGPETDIPFIVDGEGVPLEQIPFAYSENDFDMVQKRYYYETTRGCPFHCSYCLSSTNTGMDSLSMGRIRNELAFFIRQNIRQVKLVDRTFNYNEQRAIEIWSFLIDQYHNKPFQTNFHFEIAGDLFTEKSFAVLKNAPKGLFQFEIGVQTTNESVLQKISRKTSLDKLFAAVQTIHAYGTIDIHLDLIAGLPGEDWASFANSFNQVFSLHPEMLQLGFLKVLKGSPIRVDAKALGLIYFSSPPYEITETRSMSFHEMNNLKKIEDLLEIFYNSDQFRYSLHYVLEMFPDAFAFFEQLAQAWEKKGFFKRKCSRADLVRGLYHFTADLLKDSDDSLKQSKMDIFRDLLKFDYYRFDKKGNIEELMMNHSLHHAALPKNRERQSWFLQNGQPVCSKPRLEYYCIDVNQLIKYGRIVCQPSFALYEMNSDKPVLLDVLIP